MKKINSIVMVVVTLLIITLTGCDNGKQQKIQAAEEKFKNDTIEYQKVLTDAANKKSMIDAEVQKQLVEYQKSFSNVNEALKPGPTVGERSKEMLIGAKESVDVMKSNVINKYDEWTK